MLVRALAALLRPVARRIAVDGVSMIPTYAPGEYVWALRRWRPLRADIVVVVALPRDHSREIMKRVESVTGATAWLTGDNSDASTDSRSFGSVPTRAIKWVVLPQRLAIPTSS
jgi:phage repressor protein C with HTH and peptisase S24 domain